MIKKPLLAGAATLALITSTFLATGDAAAQSREEIRIVGSSTVFPFATAVAEEFGKTTGFDTPIVEPTGSGGGLKLFCQGVGVNTPDITNASRRIKQSEVALCARNGVHEIIEVKIGYDGIVIANSKDSPPLRLRLRELYLALAKQVPEPGGDGSNLVANPYTHWNQIDARLPETEIEVHGPPPTSGTRDAFNELAIEAGCKSFSGLAALKDTDKDRYRQNCRSIREDGHYVTEGEKDNVIVQKLKANPLTFGVFGFSFLDQNRDFLQGAEIAQGNSDAFVEPTFDNIADGQYPISRSLYFYVKKAHIGRIPGIPEYLAEFTSDAAWGDFGYLTDKGLIPLPEIERRKYREDVDQLNVLTLDGDGD